MSQCATYPSLDICPTQDQILPQVLALLPRGRAWSQDGGPPTPNTTICKFWNAFANVWAFLNKRICDLRREFWCATCSETRDLWLAEYGLPDDCDPFPDLCAKVSALGGVTCAYYASLAAQLGWSISCTINNCSLDAGCIEAGMSLGSAYGPSTLIVLVDLETSPAYVGGQIFGPVAGFLEAGMPISCAADLSGLDCLLQRIVHADTQIVYATF